MFHFGRAKKCLYQQYTNSILGFDDIVLLTDNTRDEYTAKVKSGNSRFYFPVAIIIAMALDAIYRIYETQIVHDHFIHNVIRIWPATTEQRNVIALVGYLSPMVFFVLLVFESWPHLETTVYFHSDDFHSLRIMHRGRNMPKNLCRILLDYFYKTKVKLHRLNIFILINVHIAATLPFFVGEIFFPDARSRSVRTILYMIIAPMYVGHTIFVVIYPNYFWLTCRYTHVRQEYYIRWLKFAMEVADRCSERATNKVVRYYNVQFEQIFWMLKDIRTKNTFWSKYITNTFIFYSCLVCYMFFILVTAKTISERIQLLPLAVFAVLFLIYIYIFSLNSSQIYINNRSIHRHMRMFWMRITGRKTRDIKNNMKLDKLNSFGHIFRFTGFRLLNHSRIDTRLFEFTFTTMAIYSLKLFGRQLAQHF